jgi:hypothetical protein
MSANLELSVYITKGVSGHEAGLHPPPCKWHGTRETLIGEECLQRQARIFALAAANIHPQRLCPGMQAALQRAHDGGRHAAGVPIHPHHRAKRLQPQGVAQLGYYLAPAVLVQDGFHKGRAPQRRQEGTWPRWSGRSAYPERCIDGDHTLLREKAHGAGAGLNSTAAPAVDVSSASRALVAPVSEAA